MTPPRAAYSPLFILLLSYTAPLVEVDKVIDDHMAWLDEHYATGRFLVSGARVPRTGGAILAAGDDPDEMRQLVADAPLIVAGVGSYELIQLRVRRHAGEDAFAAALTPPD